MAKKKDTAGKPATNPDPRKPHKMVRVRGRLADIGEVVASELEQDFTQFVNDAIRMRLEAMGHWPPRPKS